MIVGLLPALGGGIAELRRSGQDSRFIDGYLKPYAEAFDQVLYFSYCREELREYTDDAGLLSRVDVLQHPLPWSRLAVAVSLPLVHGGAMRTCSVLRSFQVTGVIPALIARALWGVPFVTTYGYWYARLSRTGLRRVGKRVVEQLGLRLAAGVIVPTEELRVHVSAIVGPERVHVIPNGVDTARFTPVFRRGDGVCRVLYVGRLEAEKNLDVLVRAAALLASRVPLALTFVGAGSLEGHLRAQVSSLRIKAEFIGVVDHRHLPRYYAGADVFVLPSFTEGHSKVLLEAMSSGLPCVVSSCEGNRSLVIHGETGLLFDPHDPETLAADLEHICSDGRLSAALGSNARDLITRRYDIRKLVAREIELLKKVAAEGR